MLEGLRSGRAQEGSRKEMQQAFIGVDTYGLFPEWWTPSGYRLEYGT